VTGTPVLWSLVVQLIWFGVTVFAGRAVLALGTRTLVVQGG